MSYQKIHNMLMRPESSPEEILDEVNEIEHLTRQDVFSILDRYGIEKNSRKPGAYRIVKKVIFRGMWIDSLIYAKMLGWICDYLDL